MGPPMPEAASAETDALWLVCHTRPRCEKKFAALMAAERFEHYLPLVDRDRKSVV